MAIDLERPEAPAPDLSRLRRRARRRLVLRRLLLALVAVGAVAGVIWLVLFSSVLAVQHTKVEGLTVLSEDEVAKAARVPRGVPLARIDVAAIQARVEDLAAVRAAEVSRSWPHTVSIEVTERQPVGVVAWEDHWRALDEQGVLFRTYAEKPAGLPRIDVRASTPVEVLAEAAKVVESLPEDLAGKVESVDARSIDAISLHLTGGALVNWGSADESADKAAVLEVLLRREARVYDVTAPGRPTIRN